MPLSVMHLSSVAMREHDAESPDIDQSEQQRVAYALDFRAHSERL